MSDMCSTSIEIKKLQKRIDDQRSRVLNAVHERCKVSEEHAHSEEYSSFTPRSRILRALLQGGSVIGPLYALVIAYSTFKRMDYKKIIFALLLKKLIRTS